jgi:hypothetical protein
LFAFPRHLAGRRGQLAGRQGLAGRGPPLGRLTTARTRDRWVRGPAGGVLGGVLFEEPSGQFLGQGGGALLALVEGDQLILLVGIEHEFKDGLGLLEPLPAEAVAGGAASHGKRWGKEIQANRSTPGHLTRPAQLQKREWTRARRRR